jgi:enoyl-CoA hydratase
MSVTLEKRSNGVATVTIDRPDVMNALDVPAKQRLGEIWRELAADDVVRAIVLTGAGERAFCAGSDLKEINRTGQMVTTDVLLDAIPGVGVPLNKPVIAALHGYCIGMGMTLALHCDLRLAAPDTIIGYPEVRHGMISAVSAMRLAEVIPQARAMEMLLLARNIAADQALEFGLLNAIVDDVQATALEWAERIAGFPAVGVQTTKRLAMFARRATYAAACAEVEAARAIVEARADYREGAAVHTAAQAKRRA